MALASAKQLLDELMGRDRNLAPAEKKHDLRWEDPEVCKHYLVKFCPNDLFVNTKADLGPCTKIHDDRLKKEYEESSHYQQMGYEDEFLRFCQGMLADVEKRIRRARQRLALGHQEGGIPTPSVLKNNDEKIKVLSERINELVAQVEQLGCEGKVEEAQGIMKLCEQLQEERETLRKNTEQNHWLQTAEIAAAQEKQMEVCDTCGAFLIVGDAQQRVDDHLMGKQHVGYAKLKAAMEEILQKRDKEREERDLKREKDRAERKRLKEEEDKRREKEREERRKRLEEERRKEAEREREKRRRERSRERRRSRSRSRSRHGRRSSSRDRKRSRSRGRRSVSRERRDRHRSRSRDHRHSHGGSRNRDSRKYRHSRSHSEERTREHKAHDRSREHSRERDRKDRKADSRDKELRKDKDYGRTAMSNDENGGMSPQDITGTGKDHGKSDSSGDGSRKSSERDDGDSDSDQ